VFYVMHIPGRGQGGCTHWCQLIKRSYSCLCENPPAYFSWKEAHGPSSPTSWNYSSH